MRFSERMGLRQAKTATQMDSMDDDLRAGLWNVFRPAFVEPLANHDIKRHGRARAELRVIWDELLKLPDDTAPTSSADATSRLKPAFLQGDYVDVYDLVDFTVQRFSYSHGALEAAYNTVLEREVSGFRFVNDELSPISNEYKLDAVEEGLAVGGRFSGAAAHLQAALKMLSDRASPDYRNSVKESISAVESAARAMTGKTKVTLGDLLPVLEQSAHIHPAQREAFSKLYGYASDEEGIRHAMLDEANVGFADAKYMLVVCAGFIAYLHAVG